MQCEDVLLYLALNRNELYRRPFHSLTNRLGIVRIILIRLHIGRERTAEIIDRILEEDMATSAVYDPRDHDRRNCYAARKNRARLPSTPHLSPYS